jgi:hypothetical protein
LPSERADGGPGRAARAEEEESRARPACRGQRRNRQSADEAAEGNRGLPDTEREPALVLTEPLHHRTTARRVDARAARARERQEHEQ